MAPWPLWQLLALRAFRRDRSGWAITLGVILCGHTLAALVVANRWPSFVLIWALVWLVIGALLWLRSRPRFGHRRDIPPGRIGLSLTAPLRRHDFLQRQTALYGPIFKVASTFPTASHRPTICIVGHYLAFELLKQHESQLEVYPPFPASRLIPGSFLRNMTASNHDRFAPIFRRAFTQLETESSDEAIRDSVRAVLSALAREPDNQPNGVDPRPRLRSMVFEILGRLLFGFAADSPAQSRLAGHFEHLAIARINRWSSHKRDLHRWKQTLAFLTEGLKVIRRDQGDSGLLGHALDLAQQAETDDPSSNTDSDFICETIVGNVMQMQESGTNDLTGLLTWVLKHLGDHPQWLERLRTEELDAGARNALPDQVIQETLRLEQSEYLYRRAISDIRFHGFRLPRGWIVRLCTREAHRRADLFDDPQEFCPARFSAAVPLPTTQYAPFGLHRHRCIASRLVQKVGRIFVSELARSYQLQIACDGDPEHRRFHWEPSPRFRVKLIEVPPSAGSTRSR